jgi:hypothetical protein
MKTYHTPKRTYAQRPKSDPHEMLGAERTLQAQRILDPFPKAGGDDDTYRPPESANDKRKRPLGRGIQPLSIVDSEEDGPFGREGFDGRKDGSRHRPWSLRLTSTACSKECNIEGMLQRLRKRRMYLIEDVQ